MRSATRTGRGLMRSGTPIAVQQKMMRHADIRTTLNIHGNVVTDEMEQAHRKWLGAERPGKRSLSDFRGV